ncbi:MAG: hypothetical protein RL154_384 [Pseudomonadota bacterium]
MEIKSARIYQRGNIWQMEYDELFENGELKRTQLSTKVKVAEKNRDYVIHKFLPAKLAQLSQNAKIQEVNKFEFVFWHNKFITFQKANKLASIDKTIARSKVALLYFGNKKDIRTITRLNVKEYINTLKDKNLHKDTIKNYVYQLSGILSLAYDDALIDKNPAKDIKVDMQQAKNKDCVEPFNKAEVTKLIETAKDDLKNYLGIAFNTGMSPEEIIALMPQDIDFENNTIQIRRVITKGEIKQETKTVYCTRTIPLFASAKNFIVDQMLLAQDRHSMFIFCNEDGSRLRDIEVIRGQIKNNTKWYGLLKECELKYRPLKNCRHTFAVEAIKSGKFTMQQIADILGHANLRMLINHYADFIQGSAKEVDVNINIFTDSRKIGLIR